MYGLDLLERTITLCLYSPYVCEEKPLSLLIIAKSGSGKSSVLEKFGNNAGVRILNQGTRYGMYTMIGNDGYSLKHFIIPDLSIVLGSHPGIAGDLIGLIDTMVEEGISNISTYHFNKIFDPRLKIGLLTAVSDKDFNAHKSRLKKVGFVSRFIPFSYTYDKNTLEKVLGYIEEGSILKEKGVKLDLPKEPVVVECEAKYVRQFREFALNAQDWETRFLVQMRILLKSCALVHGRSKVNEEDVVEILKLVIYLNFNFNPIKVE